jgi:sortase (surface protein transpeptidase)
MSRRRAATSLAAGLALIVAAPLIWWATQPEPAGQTVTSVNAAAAEELTSSVMTSGESRETTAGASGSDQGAAVGTTAAPSDNTGSAAELLAPTAPAPSTEQSTEPAAATVPAPLPEPAPVAAAAPPVLIEIPALGVSTTIVAVGVDSDGLMEIPQDVGTVGWYRFGPAPGSTGGSAVLSGHVDDYRQGAGVFGRIGDLGPGDVVRIGDEAGTNREFSVVSREEWSKDEVPLDRLFDRGGSARLVLITCGGSFNSDTLGYDDNIAITAIPVGT